MKRFTKLCLILAAVLTICGLGAAAAGYAGGAIRDIRSSASLPAGEAETIDVSAENLGRVEFRLTSEYVTIFPSQDGNLHVEYTPPGGSPV